MVVDPGIASEALSFGLGAVYDRVIGRSPLPMPFRLHSSLAGASGRPRRAGLRRVYRVGVRVALHGGLPVTQPTRPAQLNDRGPGGAATGRTEPFAAVPAAALVVECTAA